MEVYENLSGARMHAAFYRPHNLGKQINQFIVKKILNNTKCISVSLSEINSILLFNKVWCSRLKNVGILDNNQISKFSITGVLRRSCGFKEDLRVLNSSKYSFYRYLKVSSFFSRNGDSYDRYVLRLSEMYESLNIINNVTPLFHRNNLFLFNKTFFSIENTISCFKLWSSNFILRKKEAYCYIESPKGTFGLFLNISNKNTILKCKIKSPSYNNLLLLKYLLPGHQLADIITMIGTIDIVFGEVDR